MRSKSLLGRKIFHKVMATIFSRLDVHRDGGTHFELGRGGGGEGGGGGESV